jgi:hypothetical protein
MKVADYTLTTLAEFSLHHSRLWLQVRFLLTPDFSSFPWHPTHNWLQVQFLSLSLNL